MASISVPCPKISSSLALRSSSARRVPARFPKSAFSGLRLASRQHDGICRLQAKLNEDVTAETISNSTSVVTSPAEKAGSAKKTIPDAADISAFIAQVSELVKLVESRNVVELELKQLGCEVTIRKKEALQKVAPASPVVAMPQVMPPAAFSALPPPAYTTAPAPPTPTSQASPVPAPSAPTTVKTGGSSHPPLECPMAGTFYSCPAPGEPPFVKVGDKVQKGQVVCIIEAMKLMNEIEADQSGTITEILVEAEAVESEVSGVQGDRSPNSRTESLF